MPKCRISFSISLIKDRLPPVGVNTKTSFGYEQQKNFRSGLPADLGQRKNGSEPKVVKIATPSLAVDNTPRWGNMDPDINPKVDDTRRNETILSKGTNIS